MVVAFGFTGMPTPDRERERSSCDDFIPTPTKAGELQMKGHCSPGNKTKKETKHNEKQNT
jgi:hypothetical protein